ncbi:NAD(P)/FAD-dependent oxidoreductase [Citricoccus zhacaiensis]|nr:FAD-dependent oxidoreductase [Citricoccus zhacaiensis]
MSILIIGASVAGTRAALSLRHRGFDGGITLLEAENRWPYDKPSLSKEALAVDGTGEAPALLTPEMAEEFRLDIQLGSRAAALDPQARIVTTEDGRTFSYGSLIIAAGAAARQLPVPHGMAGVHTLRTQADADALRAVMATKPRVVVIGAGFIGAEFAAAARQQGLDTTIVEAMDVPMSHLFGPEVGAEVASIHEAHGTRLVTGARFQGFVGADHVEGIKLEDGTVLPAELVLVGIGVTPNTGWLADSGLPIENGINVNEDFGVVGFPGIYAIGDLAMRHHPLLGIMARIEHWTNAGEQADALATILTGGEPSAAQLPYVWSDQYGHRFQIIGRPNMGTLTHRVGSVAEGRFLALFAHEDGSPVGAVSFNDVKAITRYRKNHKRGGSVTDLIDQLTPAS